VADDVRQRVGWRGREWIVIDRHELRRSGSGCGDARIGRLRHRPNRKRIMVDRNQFERRIGERVTIDRDQRKHGPPRDIPRPAVIDRDVIAVGRAGNRCRVAGAC
jgi:hypothetical protein